MSSLIIEMTGNEYKHKTPDLNTNSRTGGVAPKGSHYIVHGIQGSMYKIQEHTGSYVWISKQYTKVIQNGSTSTTGNTQPSKSTSTAGSTPSQAPSNMDWVIGAGAGILFLMLIGKLVKKL